MEDAVPQPYRVLHEGEAVKAFVRNAPLGPVACCVAATPQPETFVRDFEEYWTFRRSGREWKLAAISASMKGKEFVASENTDEGTSKDMLQWYYSKERAL